MPASVLDGIERIFGARITPAEAVAAHPPGCPGRGGARALHEWAQRIDRRPPGPLEVPVAENGERRISVCRRNSRRRWIWLPSASPPFTGSSRCRRGWIPGRTARWDS